MHLDELTINPSQKKKSSTKALSLIFGELNQPWIEQIIVRPFAAQLILTHNIVEIHRRYLFEKDKNWSIHFFFTEKA